MNQSEERQQNINKVIKTAQALFIEHGVNNISVNRIAKESGLSAMSLYRYFGTRENLIFAVWKDSLEFFYNIFMKSYRKRSEGTENGFQRFLACMDTYIDIYSEYPEWFDYTREMFISFPSTQAGQEGNQHRPQDKEFWDKFYTWIPMPALHAMQEGQEDGSVKPDINVYEAYQLIHNVYTGTSITQNFTSDIDPVDIIRFTTDLLANYIKNDD